MGVYMNKVKLTEICDFQGGAQPPKEEWSTEKYPGYIRMLQIRDFTQKERIIPEYIKLEKKLKLCSKDDVLIARYGASLGKILTGMSGAYNVAIMKTIPDEKILRKKYLYYYFSAQYFQNFLLNVGSRAAQAGFNKEDLQRLEINCPSLKVQDKIINGLDKVSKVIKIREKQLELLDVLTKSRFVEMFGEFKVNSKGWPIVKLQDIAIIDGNMTTDYKKYANYPHIGIDCIEKNTGKLNGYRTVAEDGVISGKYLFTENHIIYSKIRPNLNKVALPNFKGVCSADAYPILPISGKCNRIFLAYNMRSQFFLSYILQFCVRTNLPKVNRKEVLGFNTPLPPIELQNEFAAFVKEKDKSRQIIQASLDETQKLFDSLMQQYFG